ncbi:hypothetical protein V6Z11_D11G217600 [Gossypium hirsutum]
MPLEARLQGFLNFTSLEHHTRYNEIQHCSILVL